MIIQKLKSRGFASLENHVRKSSHDSCVGYVLMVSNSAL